MSPRRNIDRMMNETATLERLDGATEASPGYYEPDARVDVAIPKCRFVDGPSSKLLEGPTAIGDADAILYVPGEFATAPGDWIVRTNGNRYRVVGKSNPSIREVYTKVFLEQRQAGNA